MAKPRKRVEPFRVLLDEGVPRSVGETFAELGHTVIYHQDVLRPGVSDPLVAKTAQINDAVLIACDNDTKRMAGRYGRADPKFERLNLIKFACPEPHAAGRLRQAIDLLRLEWDYAAGKVARRLYVEIGSHYIRTNR